MRNFDRLDVHACLQEQVKSIFEAKNNLKIDKIDKMLMLFVVPVVAVASTVAKLLKPKNDPWYDYELPHMYAWPDSPY